MEGKTGGGGEYRRHSHAIPEPFQKNLVDSVEACAERLLHLLQRPGERGEFGRAGREHVRRHFLMPRLVRDELRLIKQVLEAS
jgi:trehalose synthase